MPVIHLFKCASSVTFMAVKVAAMCQPAIPY